MDELKPLTANELGNGMTRFSASKGQGVPRIAEAPPAPAAPAKPDEITRRYELGAVWDRKPSLSNQLIAYPETVRTAFVRMKSFHLPSQQDQLDAFLDQTGPPEAPSIKLNNIETNANPSGGWDVLLRYNELWYREMIDHANKSKPQA